MSLDSLDIFYPARRILGERHVASLVMDWYEVPSGNLT